MSCVAVTMRPRYLNEDMLSTACPLSRIFGSFFVVMLCNICFFATLAVRPMARNVAVADNYRHHLCSGRKFWRQSGQGIQMS